MIDYDYEFMGTGFRKKSKVQHHIVNPIWTGGGAKSAPPVRKVEVEKLKSGKVELSLLDFCYIYI